MLRRTCFFCVWLLMIGCAALNQPSPERIHPIHLSCEAYPRLVDGNLATTAILKVEGGVEKDYIEPSGGGARRYDDRLIRTNKAEVFIELDRLTRVTYIEVHPVSNIQRLLVHTATAVVEPGKLKSLQESLFESVRSHKILKSENGAVIGINIDKPVLWLRLTIRANRDFADAEREHENIKVPFQDIVIREIQVYQ